MVRLLSLLLICLLFFGNCAKEYSFEAGPLIIIDTNTTTVINGIPSCKLCNSASGTLLSSWSFQTGNSSLCGEIDTAIVSPARTAFTFYGPSTCSLDSGMVISALLGTDTLNRDRTNLRIDKVAFYYYDRITPSDIFMSRQNSPFTLTIDQYSHQTKIATGSFEGSVFKTNGGGTRITSGKFHVKLL